MTIDARRLDSIRALPPTCTERVLCAALDLTRSQMAAMKAAGRAPLPVPGRDGSTLYRRRDVLTWAASLRS